MGINYERQLEQMDIKRSKELYEYVRGDGPVWDRLPDADREEWLRRRGDSSHVRGQLFTKGPNDDVLRGNVFDLARNRELAKSLRDAGHTPVVVNAEVTWLDGSVTTESVVTDKCRPYAPRSEFAMSSDGYCQACHAAIIDVSTSNIFTDIGEFQFRLESLETRVLALEADRGGYYEADPMPPKQTRTLREMPNMPPQFPMLDDPLSDIVDIETLLEPHARKARSRAKPTAKKTKQRRKTKR